MIKQLWQSWQNMLLILGSRGFKPQQELEKKLVF